MTDGRLTCSARELNAGFLVSLAGVIDENAADALYAPRTDQPVVFDLDKVPRITSYGVLHWKRTLASMQTTSYFFARIRPGMVRQFNMVSGFGVGGLLLSIYAPYYCEACELEFQRLHDLAADPRIILQRRLPVTTCGECGAQAELDDSLDSYLTFADDYAVPKVTDAVLSILSELEDTDDEGG